MKEVLESIGINVGISVAGLFGSLLLLGRDSSKDWRTSLFSILAGTASANYITPIACKIFNMNKDYQLGIAFILGFLGLKGVEMISKKIFNINGKSKGK
jgi:hypothetical protein|tara:strand:+ start:732 stop:1028 length:297 start_codon:yes stop_codon:yes gene_type:complete